MKNIFLYILFVVSYPGFSQGKHNYDSLIQKGKQAYFTKDYKEAVRLYSLAFASNSGKGRESDRYDAACGWARLGNNDSAFHYLKLGVEVDNYSNYPYLLSDFDLIELKKEKKRWNKITALYKKKRDKSIKNIDKKLVYQLDQIFYDDQFYRNRYMWVGEKYGFESKEAKEASKGGRREDSINVLKVIKILETKGWPSQDVIGKRGSTTIFAVLQHAKWEIQEKYLPVVRQAVEDKKIAPLYLGYLEDRVYLKRGGKQIYGTQIKTLEDGKSTLHPLEDPDNVDARRTKIGLGPIKDYLLLYGLKWDLEKFKKTGLL